MKAIELVSAKLYRRGWRRWAWYIEYDNIVDGRRHEGLITSPNERPKRTARRGMEQILSNLRADNAHYQEQNLIELERIRNR